MMLLLEAIEKEKSTSCYAMPLNRRFQFRDLQLWKFWKQTSFLYLCLFYKTQNLIVEVIIELGRRRRNGYGKTDKSRGVVLKIEAMEEKI